MRVFFQLHVSCRTPSFPSPSPPNLHLALLLLFCFFVYLQSYIHVKHAVSATYLNMSGQTYPNYLIYCFLYQLPSNGIRVVWPLLEACVM